MSVRNSNQANGTPGSSATTQAPPATQSVLRSSSAAADVEDQAAERADHGPRQEHCNELDSAGMGH